LLRDRLLAPRAAPRRRRQRPGHAAGHGGARVPHGGGGRDAAQRARRLRHRGGARAAGRGERAVPRGDRRAPHRPRDRRGAALRDGEGVQRRHPHVRPRRGAPAVGVGHRRARSGSAHPRIRTIGAGRMSTPFAARPGAVGTPPEHYGDPIGEQRILASGSAVVDLSDRDVVTITGPDRLSWLDSLTSQAVATLAPGVSAETMLLNPNGRVEYVARVVDDGATTWLLMDTGTGAGFARFLERMRFMLQVEVAERTADYATIGTFG